MDFSSIVLMEKDKDTGILTKELGSYKVDEGAEHITRAFCHAGIVNVIFDTARDVEDWEYSAICDEFNEEVFTDEGFAIEFMEDEYNPTWLITFSFDEDYDVVQDKISVLCSILNEEFSRVFEDIKSKQDEYTE
ncbi:hypothetical protein IAI10_20875 [Clostridium sp. 19966]|uniref:DUF6762 family protein n=1 Tax=Clostridium sp. 19966 TaxID=2768166 RepID=UPI0028DD8696|nr:DUF6762 family protein [Clostridium sp. 19966]MDT8719107.1 hypothetical protein [Clostridium sp. 19966]